MDGWARVGREKRREKGAGKERGGGQSQKAN